jgi:sugar (pentulose or hexulose) kinase
MSDGNSVIQVVLALDIGSSSIRCGAYEVTAKAQVKPLQDCFASCKVRTVEPITGKIELITEHGTSLLDEIDATIDAALLKLRKFPEPTRVVGVGFATFCMNLIALDETGKPVGKDATLSYACSTAAVAEECRWLKR